MADEAEDDFEEEDDVEDALEDEEVIDIDHLIEDLEAQRAAGVAREPAWRRLERYMEEKRTAEEISDFEDYDLDD